MHTGQSDEDDLVLSTAVGAVDKGGLCPPASEVDMAREVCLSRKEEEKPLFDNT